MSDEHTEHDGCMASLPDLLAFVEGACRRAHADEDACFALKLPAEEACVNIITHGYGDEGRGTIRLSFRDLDGRGVLTVTDQGRAFPPEQTLHSSTAQQGSKVPFSSARTSVTPAATATIAALSHHSISVSASSASIETTAP